MSKLLRCYVANYGLHSSWCDGLLMDFRSNEKPTHTIINLDNGGGKTTLLSFIFSVVDPRKDYFLKTRQNANHKVAEYFSHDGVPGTCILEWSAPIPTNPNRVYVTGRSVRIKSNQDVEDVMFCYYKDDASAIEEFPGPNLGDNVPVMSWDGLQTWLSERSRKEKSFFKNSVQATWLERLQEDGIVDSVMIRTQMKFSETEGGVDSFITFKTQEEFLRKFIELASSEEILSQVYQSVFEFKSNNAELPALEQQHNEVKQVAELLTNFQLCLQDCGLQQTRLATVAKEVVALGKTLAGHSLFVSQQTAEMELKARHASQNVLELNTTAKKLDANEKYAMSLRFFLTHQQAIRTHKEKQKTALLQARRTKHLHFLMLERQVLEKRGQQNTIQEQIAQALRKEAPLREDFSKAAIRFRRALERDLESLARKLSEKKRHSLDVSSAIEHSKKTISTLTKQAAGLEQKEALVQEKLNKLTKQKEAYEQEYKYEILELPLYIKEVIDALHEEQFRQTNSVAQLSEDKHDLLLSRNQEEQLTKFLQSELIRLESWIQKQQQREYEYSHNTHLTALAEGSPDINMPSLVSSIAQEIRRLEDVGVGHVGEIAKLKERIERLDNHQTAQINNSQETVLQWLHAQGFSQAVPAAQYISKLSSAQRTHYLHKYPHGTSGIFVHPEHVETIREKLQTTPIPDIHQNVWLTTLTGDEPVYTNGLYVLLNNDTDFDLEKATTLVEHLRQTLIHRKDLLHSTEQDTAALRQLVFNIEFYQREYSIALQNKCRSEREEKTLNLSESIAKSEALHDSLESIQLKIEKAQTFLKDANATMLAKVPVLERVRRWCSEEYSQYPALVDIQKEHNLATQQTNQECTAQTNEQAAKEKLLDDAKDNIRRYEREHLDCATELKSIKIEHALGFDFVLDNTTTDYFRSEYKRYQQLWAKVSENADAGLTIALATCEAEMNMLLQQQSAYIVPDGDALGLTMEQATKSALDDFANLATQATAEEGAAEQQSRVALLQYSPHRQTILQESDRTKESKVAVVEHEQIAKQLREAIAALAHEKSIWDALAKEGNTLREKKHSVTTRKDIFVARLRDIQFSEIDAVPIPELNMALWETEYSAAMGNYMNSATTLHASTKLKNSAYSQYERYRERYSKNIYLKAQEHHDPSLMDDEKLAGLLKNLAEVMIVMQSQIKKYQTSQSTVATELMNQATSLALLLEEALKQRVPAGAPIIGGMHVLRVKSSKTPFSTIGPNERLSRINYLLEEYLTGAKAFPSTSRDLLAQAIAALYAKPLDFQILKMVENKEERYSLVHQVKNSGAEGVTMAMCLYMTILSVRTKPEKGALPRDAGVLLIDNPFAKATSNKFWAALHNLADHYRIQFVFLTAVSDPETLRDFQHYIALTKKVDSLSGRRILTHASITFTKKDISDATSSLV